MELIACSTRPPINLFKWLGCPQPFTNWLVRMRFRKRLSKTLIPAEYSWHLIEGYLEKKTKAMTGAQKSNTYMYVVYKQSWFMRHDGFLVPQHNEMGLENDDEPDLDSNPSSLNLWSTELSCTSDWMNLTSLIITFLPFKLLVFKLVSLGKKYRWIR